MFPLLLGIEGFKIFNYKHFISNNSSALASKYHLFQSYSYFYREKFNSAEMGKINLALVVDMSTTRKLTG